jgi:hypothetical protein
MNDIILTAKFERIERRFIYAVHRFLGDPLHPPACNFYSNLDFVTKDVAARAQPPAAGHH